VSSPQRRLLHRRVAQALETLYADQLEPVSDQIAAHYDQAGAPEQAAAYYHMAGMVAAGVYDNENAILLFKHGLTALQGMPASAKRDAQELSLLLAIAPPYRFVLGWTAPELGEVLNRGLILCDKVGTPAQRAQVLYGLQSQYVVEARLEKVHLSYAEMRQLFLQTQGSVPRFAGLMYTGARLHMGQLSEARAGFEEIITSHNPEQIRDLQASQGVNYLAHANAWYAHGLWLLGLPDSALAHGLEGARIAAEVAQPFNQALTVTYLALLQELRADQEAFSAQAEQALVLSEESRATYYRQWAQIQVGFAHAWNRPSVDHLAHLEFAIQDFMETGARLRLPYFLSLLARASQQMGRMEKALETIELAMRYALTNNERCWDADLHRIRGEILLSQGVDPADAEAAFRRSLEIARTQGALAYRLRSSASLARLWISQGRQSEARELLEPLLDQFAEGQVEPDYRTAQILLS
jgi:tetratricopeptide (TPR) repeat protein